MSLQASPSLPGFGQSRQESIRARLRLLTGLASQRQTRGTALRLLQPQRDFPGRLNQADLRQPDPSRRRQTKPPCMACRTAGARISLSFTKVSPAFYCSE
jgi:hypothetical protein